MVYIMLVLGFVLLIKGADFFVEASSSVARMLRVPSIIIGLTIVAFGTSAPELAVSTTASLAGNNEIAVGNVIGSNIFNLLVVLGACGAIHAMKVRLRWDFIASIVAGMILLLMIFGDLYLSRLEAFILLGLFAGFLILTVRDALINRVEAEENQTALSPLWCVIYIVGGLTAIVWGGDLVVDSASEIALNFGLSQTLVGLTVVALGTSLPELVTSVVASRKGENGLALGNVIGSNIFNIVMVLAMSAAVKPIAVNRFAVIDAACLVVFSLITLLLCKSRERLSRPEGLTMLSLYAGYLVYICLR
ncbi:MAG: calcium/sodium antiporter [Lachnospiraceae bacterium]|nr:calcium/sodium antiporter [Lachnospiraceae bacterium]MCI9105296.1 calcium/sodium antiporter [Lachnospiraceae bacterium]